MVARRQSGLLGSPTLETLVVFLFVFGVQAVTSVVGIMAFLFVMDPAYSVRPWTLVTSVYAHAGLGHLFANSVALLVFGFLVERRTTRLRFHLFFVTTGAIAGLAEVTFGTVTATPRNVLGASGAIFALMGYLLAGNVVSETVLDRVELSGRAQIVLFVAIAIVVTMATGSAGVALLAHFTGLVLGLIAGRVQLLDVGYAR